MKYTETAVRGVWVIEPVVFADTRGYFMEAYKQDDFEQHIGTVCFMQDNESCSSGGVLRGLHYQLAPYSQAKLVRVIQGAVLDVAVDIRRGSPTFGQHVAVELSSENKRQLYISEGFAHGFRVLGEKAVFTYKVNRPYMPAYERGIRYDDPALGIDWRIAAGEEMIVSAKDAEYPLFADAVMNFEYETK
ncbi:MAG: dTDP-4-dehydrorhamnose 3,5-epimerase [Tannerella sp.]|jgi:dTDP-4-dehydrorhamnose 3,5-epimerase|nr:dTDP-4-dehydrorhamnose 3,5-epimerase [Tannerella sp.]